MDVSDLIWQAPRLRADLRRIGIDGPRLDAFSRGVSAQLDAGDSPDLAAVLGALGGNDFLGQLDVRSLATATGLDRDLTQQSVDLLAPAINAFGSAPPPRRGPFAIARALRVQLPSSARSR